MLRSKGVVGLLAALVALVAAPASAQETAEARVKRLVPEILQDVVRLRGLAQKREVPAGAMDRPALRAYLDAEMQREFPAERFATLGQAWTALGLVPAGTDLRARFLDLLQGQVAGFYDPRAKRFYLVDAEARGGKGGDAANPMEQMMAALLQRFGISNDHVVIAHELTHALQDQHFQLQGGVHERQDEDDRVLAAKCVVEGDATFLMNEYMIAKVPLLERLRGQLGAQARMDLDAMAAMQPTLHGMPRALWVPLVYPYVGGLGLVQQAHERAGWDGVNGLFADFPASTEQVLHPEKYFAAERDQPVALRLGALAAAEGWTRLEENTLGELLLVVWLREQGVEKTTAEQAAEGWGGDRFVAWSRPDGGLVAVLATQWDSRADAGEFATAAQGGGEMAADGLRVVVVRGVPGEAGRRLARTVLAGLRVADAPAPVADPERVTAAGFSFLPPGDDWAVQETGTLGDSAQVVYDHREVRGARIVVTGRGAERDAAAAVERALAGLRDAGVALGRVERVRRGETSPAACEARFTAGGERWVLVADIVRGRLVTVLGRTPPMRGSGVGLAAAVRRVAASLRGE